MAEQHRRVEPRQIVGTGMATDREEIERLQAEKARFDRAWREPPAEKFGDVMQRAPARADLEDDPDAYPDRRKKKSAAPEAPDSARDAPDDDEPDDDTKGMAAPTPAPDAKRAAAKVGQRALPRAPDPRERLLRAQLQKLEADKKR
jgi:hypothetical protein